MALRAPPHRHAAGGRRARPRRSAPRTAARASRVPSAISRGDGDRDRGERFVEAAPKEANAKASRRDEKNTALSRAVLKTALALAACAAPHVVPLAASTGVSRAGVSVCRHFAASAAERTATGEGAPVETRPADENATETETGAEGEETETKRNPDAGVDYPFVSSRDVSSRELSFRNWLADVRAECAREKETLLKQFDARIAGLRLEKEQTRHDTALFKKIERDVSEIRELTVSVLGPRAPPSGAHRRIGGPSPYASPAAYDQYDG